jgi:hypothetical protein
LEGVGNKVVGFTCPNGFDNQELKTTLDGSVAN